MKLDLSLSAAELTARLVDIESVSGNERALADLIEAAIAELPHLAVARRDGNALVARTELGRAERVAIAGISTRCRRPGSCPPGWMAACCTAWAAVT